MKDISIGFTKEEVAQMKFAMRLSLGIGILMLLMKGYAYIITGSAAILSDAAESVVHVFAVSFAAYSLSLSMKPPDESHVYGHDRISFFSAGFEGAMIILAALFIIYESIHKWMYGLQIENIDTGTFFVTTATAVNGLLGFYLVRLGKKYHSLVLEANGKHVLTDSWTSLGVIVALVLTKITGWLPFDPILAIGVACNILWTGGNLMRHSIGGLMDETDKDVDERLKKILHSETEKYNIKFHDVRHRNAGAKLFVEFHLLFPNEITIVQAHERATMIEQSVHNSFPMPTEIITHLEPIEGHDEIHQKFTPQKR